MWRSPGSKRAPTAEAAARAQVPVPVSPPAIIAQPAPVAADPAARAIDTGSLIRPDSALRQSIEAFLLDQRSPHTRRAYGKDLKRFMRYLAGRKHDRGGPEALTRSVIIAYKDSLLGEGLEHTTVDRHLATLRSFFRWLVDDGVLARSPADGVRFLNPRRLSRTLGLGDAEVVKMLSQPDRHTRSGALHRAILMVLFFCGLRRSEVCALKVSQLGQERGHFVLRLRGKGNAERIVPLQPPVHEAILHYQAIARREGLGPDSPLFAPVRNNRTGVAEKPLDPSAVFYLVRKYARQAGIQSRVSPHSCRATAVSNARDRNVPDRAIQEFAGWASADMITRYDKRKTSVEKSAALAIRYAADEP